MVPARGYSGAETSAKMAVDSPGQLQILAKIASLLLSYRSLSPGKKERRR
jgi:hypothetical protein